MSASSARVALIDAGGANLGSVAYALQRLRVSPAIVDDADGLRDADRVILPGVGAAGPAMRLLRERGFVDALRESRQPLLGVCLGMQLLYEGSDEGDVECLGLLRGRVARLRGGAGLRLPHMGWNSLRTLRPGKILAGIGGDAHVYFVHGYAAPVTDACVADCLHGERFAAVVEQGHVSGTQFHPERSGSAGARLLRNFLSLEVA